MADTNVVNKNIREEGSIEIIEGSARMNYSKDEAVFYNKVQVLNRDLSIQVISLFAEFKTAEVQKDYEIKLKKYNDKFIDQPETKAQNSVPPDCPKGGITVLDALAATGLRSVRYLKEIPGVSHVTINDISPAATAAAVLNCQENGISDPSKFSVLTGDATMLMYGRRIDTDMQYDVIDLDPYGSVIPFLDAAVQAVRHGGLLCITCTDMTVLCGNYPEVCFAKYGSMPLRSSKYVHEMSLRILLHAIDSAANKYRRHIVPWLSLSVDFYVRVFVRVYESPSEVKNSCLRRGMVYQSKQCPSFYIQRIGEVNKGKKQKQQNNVTSTGGGGGGMSYTAPTVTVPSRCEESGGAFRIGGPIWIDAIHNQEIVDEILARVTVSSTSTAEPVLTLLLPPAPATAARIVGLLSTISDELKDVPLYYNLSDLCSIVRCKTPPLIEFQAALHNAGYRMSQFHHEPKAVKTDAPVDFIWDVIRSYCKTHPPEISIHKKMPQFALDILNKEITHTVSFEIPEELFIPKKKVTRFPSNPEENWGPKRRAGRGVAVIAASSALELGLDEEGENAEDDTDLDEEVSSCHQEKRFRKDS